jgi:hypothetical protein
MYPRGHENELRDPFNIEKISDQTIEGVSRQYSFAAFVSSFGIFYQIYLRKNP